MHVILGAGGPVSNGLAHELLNAGQQVRLVSRRPVSIGNAQWVKADLLNYGELSKAAEGAEIIYLCAGLKYDAKVWQAQWPAIMQHAIDVAKENEARLIFFDNVYMYGLVEGKMVETTPYNPISKKGEVRAKVAEKLMGELKAGNLKGSIARAADFYGTDSGNSFVDMMVLGKYASKQSAQWIGDPKVLHNFTYIPDTGKALYLLGKNPESDNQIWHLPTAAPLTGKALIELAAGIYDVKPSFSTVNKFMLQLVGLFKKVVAGTVEMYYQYDHDYIFDSSKFEQAFKVKPTSYRDGIIHLSQTLYKKQ